MKYLALLLAAFNLLLAPITHASPPPDAWADAVYAFSGTGVDNPNNSIGPADGQTTNMVGLQKFITLDMGAGEEGTGSLRAFFGQVLVQTDIQIIFLDENQNPISTANRALSISTSSTSALFPYSDATRAYRYVRMNSLLEAGFSLDAVEATSYRTTTPPPATCTPRAEICGNGIDEDCSGLDASCVPSQSCTSDTWTCGEWSGCSASGQETRTCSMTSDCPGVATQSPALSRQCIPPSSSTTPPPSSSQSQSYYYYYYSDTQTQTPSPSQPTPTPTAPRPTTTRPPSASATTDVTPPTISNVQAISLDPNTEKISWGTNELADGGVEYGPEGGVQRFSPVDPTMTMDHATWLSDLQPNTAYVFRVYSRDAAGNLARSPESRFVTASDNLPSLADIEPWFASLGWCGLLNLLLLLLLVVCAASAGYWHNEAKRLAKKTQKKM